MAGTGNSTVSITFSNGLTQAFSNLVSVTINNTGAGHTAIMAISGESIPEPSAWILAGAAGLLLMSRRGRA